MSPKIFNQVAIGWAQRQFETEILTDFARARGFDGFQSREQLETLISRTDSDLRLLSTALPYGVFSEDPVSHELRKTLTPEEYAAVMRFRGEYDRRCEVNFPARVKYAGRLIERGITPEFRAACSRGKKLVREIASNWQWTLEGAAPGEWGMSRLTAGFRLTLGLELNRAMELKYRISIAATEANRVLRSHDDFFSALGIGTAAVNASAPEVLDEQFRFIADFGRWHLSEYVKLLNLEITDN